MVRVFRSCAAFILVVVSSFFISSPIGAQESSTFTLGLATCTGPGSANSIDIASSFTPVGRWCDQSWPETAAFTLNGTAPDGGDGINSISWSGLIAGDTYTLVETGGLGDMAPYVFTFDGADLFLQATLYNSVPPFDTLTLNFATCDTTDSVTGATIVESFDPATAGCTSGWTISGSDIALDGGYWWGGDGYELSLWSGLVAGSTYTLGGGFLAPYTFVYPETDDLTLWAILSQPVTADPTPVIDAPSDEDAGNSLPEQGAATDNTVTTADTSTSSGPGVTALPNTGSGPVEPATSPTQLPLIVAGFILLTGTALATRGGRPQSR